MRCFFCIPRSIGYWLTLNMAPRLLNRWSRLAKKTDFIFESVSFQLHSNMIEIIESKHFHLCLLLECLPQTFLCWEVGYQQLLISFWRKWMFALYFCFLFSFAFLILVRSVTCLAMRLTPSHQGWSNSFLKLELSERMLNWDRRANRMYHWRSELMTINFKDHERQGIWQIKNTSCKWYFDFFS